MSSQNRRDPEPRTTPEVDAPAERDEENPFETADATAIRRDEPEDPLEKRDTQPVDTRQRGPRPRPKGATASKPAPSRAAPAPKPAPPPEAAPPEPPELAEEPPPEPFDAEPPVDRIGELREAVAWKLTDLKLLAAELWAQLQVVGYDLLAMSRPARIALGAAALVFVALLVAIGLLLGRAL